IENWKLIFERKRLLNYSIDFEICIFCVNCVEYCPINYLSMIEKYKLSTYNCYELNYNQITLGQLSVLINDDNIIRIISLNSSQIKNV
ncbi:hypothetical protein Pfo_003811, partial [Paulownia fortunei]